MSVDKNMNILIVDDYKTMLRIIRNLLKQIGFDNIDEVMDGKEALDKVKGKSYGLIISDWNTEPMTGIELLREVRGNGNDVPFIIITTEDKTENILAAQQAGVNNYIIKPFNADTLRQKISSALGNNI